MRVALPVAWLAVTCATGAAQVQDHQYSREAIEIGSRLYVRECALCHGPNGDEVDGVDLRRGRFVRVLSDQDIRDLITAGIPDAGMPGIELRASELDGLVAFIRAGFDATGVAVRVGDAGRGRLLFEGKAECSTCHRVHGRGPRLAPDLSDIGAIRPAGSLERALLDPTGAMLPINRPVRAVTRDGEVIRGRRLNEDTHTVQIVFDDARLVSLEKADLREYQILATSPMPAYGDTLSREELADLLAYLLSLKGEAP
jgi:putative heme-binding domain-containing protein